MRSTQSCCYRGAPENLTDSYHRDGQENGTVVPGLPVPDKYVKAYTSVPQPGLDNRTSVLYTGAVVGGGTVVNGMFFNRGSAADYDAWERLGNPGWGWEDLLHYFMKVGFGWLRMARYGLRSWVANQVVRAKLSRRRPKKSKKTSRGSSQTIYLHMALTALWALVSQIINILLFVSDTAALLSGQEVCHPEPVGHTDSRSAQTTSSQDGTVSVSEHNPNPTPATRTVLSTAPSP